MDLKQVEWFKKRTQILGFLVVGVQLEIRKPSDGR